MIPKKVKIGAHTYRITFFEEADHDGRLDREKGVIYIKRGLQPTEQYTTFIHEALHAMNNEIDEPFTESLAQQISQFLLDNKLIHATPPKKSTHKRSR